jgi:hypothetical protein
VKKTDRASTLFQTPSPRRAHPTPAASAPAQSSKALIRGAASELPQVPLDDALRVCLLLRDKEPARYGRAVVRWLGRYCLEQPGATLANLQLAMDAFEALPVDPEWAIGVLSKFCR